MEVYTFIYDTKLTFVVIDKKIYKYMGYSIFILVHMPWQLITFTQKLENINYIYLDEMLIKLDFVPDILLYLEANYSKNIPLEDSKKIFGEGNFIEYVEDAGENAANNKKRYIFSLPSGQKLKMLIRKNGKFMKRLPNFEIPPDIVQNWAPDVRFLVNQFVGKKFCNVVIDREIEFRVESMALISFCGVKLQNPQTGERITISELF